MGTLFVVFAVTCGDSRERTFVDVDDLPTQFGIDHDDQWSLTKQLYVLARGYWLVSDVEECVVSWIWRGVVGEKLGSCR